MNLWIRAGNTLRPRLINIEPLHLPVRTIHTGRVLEQWNEPRITQTRISQERATYVTIREFVGGVCVSLAFWHEKMADPYRETDSSGTTRQFCSLLTRHDFTRSCKTPKWYAAPDLSFAHEPYFSTRVNINLPGGGYVGVAHHDRCVDFWC